MMALPKESPFLKFVTRFFKICGVNSTISYNNLNRTSNGDNSRFARSKLGLLYNSLLTCIALSSSYIVVQQSYYADFAARIEFEKVFETVHSLFMIFAAIFVLLLYCVRRGKIIEIADKLLEVSEATMIFHRRRESMVKCLKVIFGLYGSLFVLHVLTTPLSSTMLLMYLLSMTMCNCVTNAILLQYSVCLILLRHSFEIVNEDLLQAIIKESKRSEPPPMEFQLNLVKSSQTQLSVSKLVRLRSQYKSLSKVSRELCYFYSLPMLVCLTNVFFQLIIYAYYIFKPIVVEKHYLTSINIVNCVCQVLLTVVTLWILARSATTTVTESKVAGEIVNDCVAHVTDRQIFQQLYQFSNYVLHTNLQFSVYNLFPIDETLIMSITSYITTYLVILLQFKESSLP